MLRREAVSERVTLFEEAQQDDSGRHQSRVEYYTGLEEERDNRGRAGSSMSSGESDTPRRPERKCKRKE